MKFIYEKNTLILAFAPEDLEPVFSSDDILQLDKGKLGVNIKILVMSEDTIDKMKTYMDGEGVSFEVTKATLKGRDT